jgi:phosphate acetyltransferase
LQNVIDLTHALWITQPKVAILSAVETITSKIPSTIDAAALCKMADRGQITGAVLDGPLAFDNAISREAAAIKHITSPVAGDADILLVPDLEAGNLLAKELTFLANADATPHSASIRPRLAAVSGLAAVCGEASSVIVAAPLILRLLGSTAAVAPVRSRGRTSQTMR